MVFFKDKKIPVYVQPDQASDSAIESYKNSNDTEDLRSLSSVYVGANKYPEAVEVARKVALKTGEVMDYMTLLNICAIYNVPTKQACLEEVAAKLKPQLGKLSFYNAYTAGRLYDKSGDTKNAVIFYQRAYDVYDVNRADEYIKTKEELKKRIDELS